MVPEWKWSAAAEARPNHYRLAYVEEVSICNSHTFCCGITCVATAAGLRWLIDFPFMCVVIIYHLTAVIISLAVRALEY